VRNSVHNAAFNRTVALEAIRERKTISEIAAAYSVHPIQGGQWKKQLIEGIDDIFESPAKNKKVALERAAVEDSLHEKIGRLTMELDWLKKKVQHA
jgi:transposase-like protein